MRAFFFSVGLMTVSIILGWLLGLSFIGVKLDYDYSRPQGQEFIE